MTPIVCVQSEDFDVASEVVSLTGGRSDIGANARRIRAYLARLATAAP